VVLAVGVTFAEPLAGNVPKPVIFTLVAFELVQVSTATAPLLMLFGRAERVMAGSAGAAGEFFNEAEAGPPPQPLSAITSKNKHTNMLERE
jgi:hypothetical protein